jgi:hypothetical protein
MNIKSAYTRLFPASMADHERNEVKVRAFHISFKILEKSHLNT